MTAADETGGVAAAPPGSRLRVVVASAILLFAQLVIIRWTGSEIPRLAFFKNLVLIAAFLGGGIGLALGPKRPRLAWVVPPLLGLFAVAIPLLGPAAWVKALRFGGVSEFHWDVHEAVTVLQVTAFFGFFLVLFLASVLLFAGLGALVGEAFSGLDPLPAYVANLAGSLAGVLLFAAASWLELSPPVWLAILALPLGLCLAPAPRGLLAAAAIAGTAAVAWTLSEPATWSLYSRILVKEGRSAQNPGTRLYELDVDRAYFMRMMDLGPSAPATERFIRARRHYDLPYAFAQPKSVLVLGAGGGNDVAAALRAGATHVDAVEIDPAIIRFGRALHPEAPYSSARVNVVVDDARSFLRRTDGKYDLVVLGLLDSHTLLAGLPGVRLDNFVYTVESLRDARRHIAPGGLIALSFAVSPYRPWMAVKLEKLVAEAFGEEPLVLDVGYDVSFAFLAGDGLRTARGREAAAAWARQTLTAAELARRAGAGAIDVSTDDWPHLYLRDRAVPGGQLLLLMLLLAVSAVLAARYVDLSGAPDLHFALLGAGFLLVETKGIADLGLLFGGTWWTVTAAFSGVLVMALLSALVVSRWRPASTRLAYAGLFVALALGFLVRPGMLIGLPLPAARMAGTLLFALPVFFSGIVFATSFSRVDTPSRSLGWNLLGAVGGGFLEYASLAVGVRALGLLAIALYAGSAAALRRKS